MPGPMSPALIGVTHTRPVMGTRSGDMTPVIVPTKPSEPPSSQATAEVPGATSWLPARRRPAQQQRGPCCSSRCQGLGLRALVLAGFGGPVHASE